MKLKLILLTTVLTILFLTLCLYGPVFYDYHQQKYGISHNAMFSVFMGMFLTGIGLLASIVVTIVSGVEDSSKS